MLITYRWINGAGVHSLGVLVAIVVVTVCHKSNCLKQHKCITVL